MSGADKRTLLGISGGKSALELTYQTLDERFETRLTSTDLQTDLSSVIEAIDTGLRSLASMAGVEVSALYKVPAYLGLISAGNLPSANTIRSALPFKHAVVEDNRRCTVIGALGEDNGSVICIDTGSFVSRQINGEARLLGGHGPVLGNEASGSWLGKKLLERVLHCEDGLVSSSALIRSTWEKFDGLPERLLDFAHSASVEDFATLAPDITRAAESDDPNARYLMRLGAAYIKRSLEALEHKPDERICMLGGFAEDYAAFLPAGLRDNLAEPKGSSLDGALQLARRFSASVAVSGDGG